MKNCIRSHYEKLKPLQSGFIENSNFENNRDPWVDHKLSRELLEGESDSTPSCGILWSGSVAAILYKKAQWKWSFNFQRFFQDCDEASQSLRQGWVVTVSLKKEQLFHNGRGPTARGRWGATWRRLASLVRQGQINKVTQLSCLVLT